MIILSIDTSCDETAAAVTEDSTILSNVLWSQASMHSEFGGVFPSLAQRAHQERIDFVIEKAILKAFPKNLFPEEHYELLIAKYVDSIAVTAGPGLAIALGVGIAKAKELSLKHHKPLLAVNHIEGHLLSPLAKTKTKNPNDQFPGHNKNTKHQSQVTSQRQPKFPAISLVASGKHTDLIYVEEIGKYKIIAHTLDDALGEALDKAARMLGLGYPGGAVLEKLALKGDKNLYTLPIPLRGQEARFEFSYSGVKTAMWKLVESSKPLSKEKIQNLAAVFQNVAFKHVEGIVEKALEKYPVKSFLFGGGVSANLELRKRLRKIVNAKGIVFYIPYTKKLCTDNAGMIGVAAHFKALRGEIEKEVEKVDREARAKIDSPFKWQ